MIWEEGQIWLKRDDAEDTLVRCWYAFDNKWRIFEEVDKYVISLGMIGPNYEEHGQRLWVKVWRSPSLEEAQRTVERQENPPRRA